MFPVDPVHLKIPDYFKVVKHPMDLSTVNDKLKNGYYQLDKEFDDDVNLIWSNAMLFNPEGSEIHIMAKNMKEEFERLKALPND